MVYSETETILRVKQKLPSIYAFITARGGSKGVLRKNVRMLAGKPLIAYSIEAAKKCSFIQRIFVTTEDVEIKEISLQLGAEVIDRPQELSNDTALSSEVICHLLERLCQQEQIPDYFVLLQPTSPLRTAAHLNECIPAFLASKYASCISVTECEHHPYKLFLGDLHELKPLMDYETLNKPRQALPKVYRPNGAIYILSSTVFLEQKRFCVHPIFPYLMDNYSSVDIDTELDLQIAELILREIAEK